MAAKGIQERVLIPALRKQGLSVREARAAIDAVFDSIKNALGRHEQVELPIGTFTARRNPEQRRAWRFGQVTTLYAHRYKVQFLPSAELNRAAAAAPPSPPRPKRKKREKEIVKSDLTISAELIVDFIRKNVQPGDRSRFFDGLRHNPSTYAMFLRVKPKSEERRPLSAAAQVIEECAPKQMPEDSQRRLDTCLEWFARWTQRVMPNALWQHAMQEAQKTSTPG